MKDALLVRITSENEKLGYVYEDINTGNIFNSELELAQSLSIVLSYPVDKVLSWLKQRCVYVSAITLPTFTDKEIAMFNSITPEQIEDSMKNLVWTVKEIN